MFTKSSSVCSTGLMIIAISHKTVSPKNNAKSLKVIRILPSVAKLLIIKNPHIKRTLSQIKNALLQ